MTLVAGGVTIGAWPNGGQKGGIATLRPVGPATPPDPLLNGPTGPGEQPIYGRAYPVGTAIDQRRKPAVLIAYEAATSPDGLTGLCLAIWRPSTALTAAHPLGCSAAVSPALGATITFDPVFPSGATTIDSAHTYITITSADLSATLPRDTVRAELVVAKSSDVPAQAASDGSSSLKAQRLPVTLLGSDNADMPALIGTVAPLPPDYIIVGFDAWNAAGQRTVHELTDSYCGKSPAGATRYPVAMTNLRVSC